METPVNLPRSISNLWVVSILRRETKRRAMKFSAAKKMPIRVEITSYWNMTTT